MAAKILDGKKIAAEIRKEIKGEVTALAKKNVVPGLAVILVGSDPASKIYVNSKKRACEEVGIKSQVVELAEDSTGAELLEIIEKLNNDPNIHGILVQLPVPEQIDKYKILRAIAKEKDVDGFHPENFGEMAIFGNSATFKPCTAMGVMEILKRNGVEVVGKECVVVGKSEIVGKPTALLLLSERGTVTICHSKTKNLARHCRRADILVSAVGRAGLIMRDMVKAGATVIDVGVNRLPDGKIAGDVDFETVKEIAGAITPVPGGIGPLTIAELLKNTVSATKRLTGND